MKKAVHFPGLDALRGIAAISVLLFHANNSIEAAWMMQSAPLAVDLFFAMSGFVIAHAYEGKMAELGTVGFLKLRLIRLYPLYILGLVIGFLWALALLIKGSQVSNPFVSAISYALFLPDFQTIDFDGGITPLNGPAWSLIFEFWMNVAYALMFRRLTSRLLIGVAVAAACVLVVVGLGHGGIAGGPHWSGMLVGAARILYSFPLGILLYRYRDRLPDVGGWGPWFLVGVAGFFMAPSNGIAALLFVLLASPILVLSASQIKKHVPLASMLAASSYCIYIIHDPILIVYNGIANTLDFKHWYFALAVVLTVVLLAPAIDRFYDRPIRRLLSSKVTQ